MGSDKDSKKVERDVTDDIAAIIDQEMEKDRNNTTYVCGDTRGVWYLDEPVDGIHNPCGDLIGVDDALAKVDSKSSEDVTFEDIVGALKVMDDIPVLEPLHDFNEKLQPIEDRPMTEAVLDSGEGDSAKKVIKSIDNSLFGDEGGAYGGSVDDVHSHSGADPYHLEESYNSERMVEGHSTLGSIDVERAEGYARAAAMNPGICEGFTEACKAGADMDAQPTWDSSMANSPPKMSF